MTNSRNTTIAAMVAALAAVVGCGSDDGGGGARGGNPGTGGSVGVAQGGAQDFGRFREILDRGEIPGPETIDAVGFFNEHKIELPPPECEDDVCIHGLLGVMGNMISGSECTMVMVGLNTPIDPAKVERPPLNLALVIDTSGSMAGEKLTRVKRGLDRMLGALSSDDRIHLVAFDDTAHVLGSDLAADSVALELAIQELRPAGATNLYDGLRTGLELVESSADDAHQNRVLFLSDGQATAGIVQRERLVALAQAYAGLGITVSTIGLGADFDVRVMREVAESGAGAFYFVEDAAAVEEVFVEEVDAFLIPLAEQAEIEIDASSGYGLAAVYGTRSVELAGNRATISIPTLQIAHRTSAEDDSMGRRGGGGAIIAELLALEDGNRDVGEVVLRYTAPASGETVEQRVEIRSPLDAGELPERGYFAEEGVGKAFVMLNVFVGFQMAAELARAGDDSTALSVLRALERGMSEWLDESPDPDLEDDLVYVDRFIDNLEARGTRIYVAPAPEPWPRD